MMKAKDTARFRNEARDEGEEDTAANLRRKTMRLRMTVDFPAKTAERLVRLKEKTEAPSYVEVLRNAIRVYEILVDAEERGEEFVLKKPDGTNATVHIGS